MTDIDRDIDRIREALHSATVDANAYRDALKDILRLCDENRRGIVSEIESIANRALWDGSSGDSHDPR